MTQPPLNMEALKLRALPLKLHGLLAHWDEVRTDQWPWIATLLDWEEQERNRRGLEKRMRDAHLGRFKPLVDFDWLWLQNFDRGSISELMTLAFLAKAENAVFVGLNGTGKTTIAKNIAHYAVLQGHTVLFTSAASMLNELAAQDGDIALKRRLSHYVRPHFLLIDEVGYLSYGNRHADLLFEVINRRYEFKSTLVTTNRPFSEWAEVFPNASCVVSLVDRLVHHAEIISFIGESYRMKEAKERAQKKVRKGKRKE